MEGAEPILVLCIKCHWKDVIRPIMQIFPLYQGLSYPWTFTKNTSKDSLSPNGKVIVQTSAFTLSTSIDQKRLVHTVPNNEALKAKLPPPSPPTFLSLFLHVLSLFSRPI